MSVLLSGPKLSPVLPPWDNPPHFQDKDSSGSAGCAEDPLVGLLDAVARRASALAASFTPWEAGALASSLTQVRAGSSHSVFLNFPYLSHT